MPKRALLLVLAGAAVLVVLFLVLRPDDDGAAERPEFEPIATSPAEPETETDTATETETDAAPAPPPAPEVTTFRIQFRGGNVVGDRRYMRVERGERVRIVVRSDVADHVHVHGYDLMRDVGPGKPAQVTFRATLTGRFEIELEDRGLQIAELEVRP